MITVRLSLTLMPTALAEPAQAMPAQPAQSGASEGAPGVVPVGNTGQTQPEPPHISPARGPPLWEECDVQMADGMQIEPDWDLAAQPAPDFDVEQRVTR